MQAVDNVASGPVPSTGSGTFNAATGRRRWLSLSKPPVPSTGSGTSAASGPFDGLRDLDGPGPFDGLGDLDGPGPVGRLRDRDGLRSRPLPAPTHT